MSKSNLIEPNRNSKSTRKDYIAIFALGIILLIIGFILTAAMTLTPVPSGYDGEYETYIDTIRTLSALSLLFRQLGVLFFSISSFIGAIGDERLSGEVKRGMIIASSLGILALVIMTLFSGILGL